MSPTTDIPASIANRTVGQLFEKLTVAAEDVAITRWPWLMYPGFKQVWEALFGYFTGLFGKAFGTTTAYIVMDVQDYFALTNAAQVLASLQKAQASGDEDAIEKASDQMDAAVAPILHYVGDARVH